MGEDEPEVRSGPKLLAPEALASLSRPLLLLWRPWYEGLDELGMTGELAYAEERGESGSESSRR